MPFLLLISLVVLVVGVTLTALTYMKTSEDNSVNTGRISMNYNEASNALTLENALPMSDEEGINQTNFFEFTVTSSATTNANDDIGVTIPYEVNISDIAIDTDKILLTKDKIKISLAKVVDTKEKQVIKPTLISNLDSSTLNAESLKVYDTGNIHKNNNGSITTRYRLRVWIDKDVDVNSSSRFYEVDVDKCTQYMVSNSNITEEEANSKCVFLKNIINDSSVTKGSEEEFMALDFITVRKYQYKFRVNVNSGVKSLQKNNLSHEWKTKAKNYSYYSALYTLDTTTLPETYTHNNETFNLYNTIDVSEQENRSVLLGEYLNATEDNMIALIGQLDGVVAPADSSFLFSKYTDKQPESNNIEEIEAIKLDNEVRTLEKMESRDYELIDLSNFDTNKAISMRGMFYECAVRELDLSKFDTSNVTDMNLMFSSCSRLTSLDLSSFNTSKVIDMSYMFDHCYNLTSLDLKPLDTGKVTSMYRMFRNCESLKSIDLSTINTSNVYDMESMFEECSSLTNIDLTHFNTSNVSRMKRMFYYCSGLTSLDLSSFDTSKVINMSNMFSYSNSLTSITVGCKWDTSNVTSGADSSSWVYMFSNCGTSEVTKVCNE